MSSITTPHISCTKEKFADTVIMPGDPLRAKYIAENFLQNPELVNNVRGIQGYTGLYKGVRVSVMASGMGGPSMGIYSHELYNYMGVENIIRVGTCGALTNEAKLGDIILAMGACTNSNFVGQFELPGTFAPIASFSLLEKAAYLARERKISCQVGNVATLDNFYNGENNWPKWQSMGVLAVEMETAILYTNAAFSGKNALAILSVSEELNGTDSLTPEERQTKLNGMIYLALDLA